MPKLNKIKTNLNKTIKKNLNKTIKKNLNKQKKCTSILETNLNEKIISGNISPVLFRLLSTKLSKISNNSNEKNNIEKLLSNMTINIFNDNTIECSIKNKNIKILQGLINNSFHFLYEGKIYSIELRIKNNTYELGDIYCTEETINIDNILEKDIVNIFNIEEAINESFEKLFETNNLYMMNKYFSRAFYDIYFILNRENFKVCEIISLEKIIKTLIYKDGEKYNVIINYSSNSSNDTIIFNIPQEKQYIDRLKFSLFLLIINYLEEENIICKSNNFELLDKSKLNFLQETQYAISENPDNLNLNDISLEEINKFI